MENLPNITSPTNFSEGVGACKLLSINFHKIDGLVHRKTSVHYLLGELMIISGKKLSNWFHLPLISGLP